MKNFDESKLKQEFSESKDLQDEFGGDVTSYMAFRKAEFEGRVKISRPVTSGPMNLEKFHKEVEVEELSEKIEANEAELKRLARMKDELQKRDAESEKNLYSHGIPCQA